MTWEWSFIVVVAMICVSVIYQLNAARSVRVSKDTEVADLKTALAKVIEVQNKITADMLEVKKVGDEAQKLLSEANLVAGFKPRGMR